jgi:hypothetical protein
MSTIRVKDLWQVRTAVEKFLTAKVPVKTALRMAPMAEVLHAAFTDYQVSRKRIADDLGLTAPIPKWKFWVSRKALEQAFNDQAAVLASEEFSLPPALSLADLDGFPALTSVELFSLINLGVLRG